MIILYSIVLGRCCLITCLSRSVDYFYSMEEIWNDVYEYEWRYQVSNIWRIKSLFFSKKTIMKPKWWSNVYLYIRFKRKWKLKRILVHRLVAQAFIPNPENKPQVNHINWIKTDNRVDNLEWVTAKQNMQHAKENWLMNHSFFKLNNPSKWNFWESSSKSKKVYQYNFNLKFIKEWWSLIDIERELSIKQSSISMCCNWKRVSAGWFIWKFNKNVL